MSSHERVFFVLASDRDIAHRVFKSPAYAVPCIVPIAKGIFGGYISQNAVKKIADDLNLVTAFLKARQRPTVRANIAKGVVPNCIVDRWVLYMTESLT
ncbi:cytochrome P450 61 [Colletotrichum tabaci]|uniref:Cytochrome P450 61 n=1 Tax=Colletotrichum tabaci TaxID=1209068 RepID=A0AAV9TXC1_9PEZI